MAFIDKNYVLNFINNFCIVIISALRLMNLNQKNKYENNLWFQKITFPTDNVLKFNKIRHSFFC